MSPKTINATPTPHPPPVPPSKLLQVSAFMVIYQEKECTSIKIAACFLTQSQSTVQSKQEQQRQMTSPCPGSQGISNWPGCHYLHLSSLTLLLESSKYPARSSPQHHCQHLLRRKI